MLLRRPSHWLVICLVAFSGVSSGETPAPVSPSSAPSVAVVADPADYLLQKSASWTISVGVYAGYRLRVDGSGNFALTPFVQDSAGGKTPLYGTISRYGYGAVIMHTFEAGHPLTIRLDVKQADVADVIATAVDSSGRNFPLSSR